MVPKSAAKNAPVSSCPSIATLTTPLRSHITPASAPKISGSEASIVIAESDPSGTEPWTIDTCQMSAESKNAASEMLTSKPKRLPVTSSASAGRERDQPEDERSRSCR